MDSQSTRREGPHQIAPQAITAQTMADRPLAGPNQQMHIETERCIVQEQRLITGMTKTSAHRDPPRHHRPGTLPGPVRAWAGRDRQTRQQCFAAVVRAPRRPCRWGRPSPSPGMCLGSGPRSRPRPQCDMTATAGGRTVGAVDAHRRCHRVAGGSQPQWR